ncbi:Mth938-like domain-containing protein [Paracoccus bogoriensis]|uniref:Mth938-like domain-containing protein n=1 Tax=Paracoccus bogoriensis TaxID=242065 RepID=UPI001C727E17|nr:Mth938-like domain-containing protein [Paracoccus bogoriensis]MBW7057121.1 Mth938-like domain-containing protein [Paracoccus bogoriensis]
MALSPSDFSGDAIIQGYGPGFFRVAGQVIRGPVLVEGDQGQPWGGLGDEAALLALAGRVDVLFLGTGAQPAYPPRGLFDRLGQAGIRAEAMPSPNAARTYNVTRSEGRRVACALLPL